MKILGRSSLVFVTALAAIAAAAHGAQPPDVVSSDAGGNTEMGSSAFANLTAGTSNTASGFNALYFNTTGYYNTASGFGALFSNTSGYNNAASGYETLYSNTGGS